MISFNKKASGLAIALGLSLAFSQGASASCAYKINNQWDSGLTAEITVTNSGSTAVSHWSLGWQYGSNRVASSWSANVSGSNPYTASNLDWNGNLQPGQSVSFGVQVDKHGGTGETPTLTGALCSGTATSSSAPSSAYSSTAYSSTAYSSSSAPASSSSLASSSNGGTGGQQCNWYGSLVPLCNNMTSGWGWENNASCIGRNTCINIVGSSSSIQPSSSSRSSVSSSLSTSQSVSSSSSSVTTGPVTIAPNDPKIRYNGRVSVTATAALYDWANTQIEFRTNAPQIELLLNDGKNDYNLFVDDQLKNTISTSAGITSYPVSLGQGDHHILLTKRTGPNFGSGQFLGLRLPQGGSLLDLPPAPAHKIEFIGDSFTVGYGDEGPGLDCGGVYRPYENSYLSYAPVAARALGAQSHSIAISGLGAVRNYGDASTTSAAPMPYYYNRTLVERPDLPWNFQSWVADAVVIKLGTNDYSTPPNPPADVYIQGINGLISQVTSAYGKVPVILLADSSLPQVISNLQTVVQQQQALGNNNVHFVEVNFPPQSQLGCDWHPSVAGQASMASELVTALKPILGW